MLTAIFTMALLVNGLIAFLSRSEGLQKLAMLLIANYAVCNAVASFGGIDPPQRMAVFAVADLLFLGMAIFVMLSTHILPRLRWGVIFTSLAMLCAHVTVLAQPKLSYAIVYTYDTALNVLFLCQVGLCGVGGGIVVAKLIDHHRLFNGGRVSDPQGGFR